MKIIKQISTALVLCSLLCSFAVANQTRSKDSSCRPCSDAADKCCISLPQPPKDTPVSLEGENCICCFESRDLPSGSRDLNENKDCQSYKAMCKLFCKPLDYPGIQFPEELTYALVPTFTVPDCQKIVNPPVVPDDIKLSLKHKHVLVIGGSKGIGKAVAERFRDEGAYVIATSRHPECYKKPHGYKLKQLDVRFEDEVAAFVKHVAKKHFHGQIDIVVNCPGIIWRGPMAEATGNDVLNVLNNNVAGYQRVVHNALPYMRHSNETRIISMGSTSSTFALGYQHGVYSIGKIGLQVWNDILQQEEMLKKAQGLVQYGPRFSLFEPFLINTTTGLYEYYKASALSVKDPLVLGARLQTAVEQNVTGSSVSLVAEYVYRVAVAPQPGVRYAAVNPTVTIEVPGVGPVPVLTVIQLLNALSPDQVVQLFVGAEAGYIEGTQALKEIVTEAYCKDCKHHCHKGE